MRRRLGDPDDARGLVAVEDDSVLGLGDAVDRAVEIVEVGVDGAPLEVDQLVARHREPRAQLDERQHAALARHDAVARRRRQPADAAEVGGGVVEAERPGEVDEAIAFSFSNGEPVRMTRGEMLLHVAMHAAGHRGQVALLLQKNGIQPFPDRLTDFLKAEDAGVQPKVSAEVMP